VPSIPFESVESAKSLGVSSFEFGRPSGPRAFLPEKQLVLSFAATPELILQTGKAEMFSVTVKVTRSVSEGVQYCPRSHFGLPLVLPACSKLLPHEANSMPPSGREVSPISCGFLLNAYTIHFVGLRNLAIIEQLR
jgi:hypothetical protein